MTGRGDWRGLRNILCVRPDNLGDVLMTTPAIRSLRNAVSGRRITLLCSSAASALADCIPEIDESLVFDPPWYKHDHPAAANEITEVASALAAKRFDGAVIFNVFSQNPLPTAMLCYLAGIPRIAAYCRENPYALVTDWLPDKEPLYGVEHEVQRQLNLAAFLGGTRESAANLSLSVPPDARARTLARLASHGFAPSDRWLVLHPGVSEAKRCYPEDRFATVVRLLHEELGYRVLLTGTEKERPLVERIAKAAQVDSIPLAGRLRLDELIALLELAPLLVANNTGPVHIAAALQTPVVVLYALTNPQHAPWRVAHRVLPFDVPAVMRSKNVLIRYAGEQFFRSSVGVPEPRQVTRAVRELLTAGEQPCPSAELVRAEESTAEINSSRRTTLQSL